MNIKTEHKNKQSEVIEIPKGYLMNAHGHLVPKKMVSELDMARDKVVKSMVKRAKELQDFLAKYKIQSMSDIEEFVQYSAKQYQTNLGGKKGNVTLMSFDGSLKVQRSFSEHVVFDERLQVAKALVDECIKAWVKNSRSEIKVLIDDAFQTDKAGKINTARVLGLKNLKIEDETWQRAMQAISDSLQVSGSKSYIRLYEKDETGEFRPVSLDLAAV